MAGALIREIQHERRKLVAAFEETGTPPPRACRLIQGGTARFHESLNFLIDVRDHPLDENEAITEGLIRAVASYCVEELKGLARKENEMRTRWRDCKPEMKKSALYVRAAAEKPWKMIPADI